jgi:hypothetical protein
MVRPDALASNPEQDLPDGRGAVNCTHSHLSWMRGNAQAHLKFAEAEFLLGSARELQRPRQGARRRGTLFGAVTAEAAKNQVFPPFQPTFDESAVRVA